ncbi:winged helix-turn-helix transcriptional regulator [Qipengyuania sp. RANM35]|uniref:winged helix-turn-helix transcriptional regulator n=1 Tax=Qipengyuania sp. RANM35 TaxID=3068635 RepID=UPI0034DB6C6D
MGDLREPLRELTECGLPQALEVMGERWSFMILRASFNGLHHFEEFLTELGIARNILSNRLAKLVEHGILKRDPCAEDRRKIEYRLTEKGFDLLPAMVALRQWGQKYGSEVVENPVLVDERDRLPIGPTSILSHDGRILGPQDLWLVERNNLGIRADGSRATAEGSLANGDVVDLGAVRKAKDAA